MVTLTALSGKRTDFAWRKTHRSPGKSRGKVPFSSCATGSGFARSLTWWTTEPAWTKAPPGSVPCGQTGRSPIRSPRRTVRSGVQSGVKAIRLRSNSITTVDPSRNRPISSPLPRTMLRSA